MRILAAAIVIGPLMLIGAAPFASAGQPIRSDTPVQLAAGTAAPTDRDTYTHEAQVQMQEWQRKLQDVGKSAETKSDEAGDAAGRDLNKAWVKAEAASRDLQTASAEGWDSAKVSYDNASRDLAAAWHKVHPEDK